MTRKLSSPLQARIYAGHLPHIIANQDNFTDLLVQLTACLEQENSGTRGDILDTRKGQILYSVRKRPIDSERSLCKLVRQCDLSR